MMSKKCKYALKALIQLGKIYPDGKLTTGQIAETESISKKFLEQIMLELKRSRIVSSKLGSKGGYYLILPPEKITLAKIYRIFDGAIALVPCVSINFYEPCDDCTDEAACTLKKEFSWVRDEAEKLMDQVTLNKLII